MKKSLIKIIIASILYILALFIDFLALKYLLFLISYIIIGSDIVIKAFKNLLRGKVLDENFLMTIATLGAFFIKEYSEAIFVMLFYQIGEFFQSYAVNKSRKSITEIMSIRPDYANLKENDKITKVSPEEVLIGQLIVIKAGEKVPLDSIVVDGNTMIDTSVLTGESMPQEISKGSEILSGCINISGTITAKVQKSFEESTVSKILDLIESSTSKKSKSEKFITKFAKYYTPIVVFIALFIAILMPFFVKEISFDIWLYRALSFLVVSCPCALVISVPLSFFSGIGGASKKGILVKGSNYLEMLSSAKTIVFDKTGTLTKGIFDVKTIKPKDISQNELLEIATYAENYSTHPISLSLKRKYNKEVDTKRIKEVKEIAGYGVSAIIDDKNVLVGNAKLMKENNIDFYDDDLIGTIVHVAVNNNYFGYISISDQLKDDSKLTIDKLKELGIKDIYMLTGDNEKVAKKVAKDLCIDKVYSGLLPIDKVKKVEDINFKKDKKSKLIFVGDGINDAPVLALSDIGISMGALGSDAAIEASDIVIMNDEPSKIITAIKISKKTLNIVKQNIIFSIGIKVLVLFFSAFGITNIWLAIFADVIVSIIAILNAIRTLNVNNI